MVHPSKSALVRESRIYQFGNFTEIEQVWHNAQLIEFASDVVQVGWIGLPLTAFGQFDREGFRKRAAVVGVLVIVAFALIQAVHVHPDLGLADNSHCAICAVAHSTPAVAAPVVLPVLLIIHLPLVLFEPFLVSFNPLSDLYSRPPPAAA